MTLLRQSRISTLDHFRWYAIITRNFAPGYVVNGLNIVLPKYVGHQASLTGSRATPLSVVCVTNIVWSKAQNNARPISPSLVCATLKLEQVANIDHNSVGACVPNMTKKSSSVTTRLRHNIDADDATANDVARCAVGYCHTRGDNIASDVRS